MSDAFAREEAVLTDALSCSARGPKRNGLFAVWLFVRVCGDLGPPHPVTDRNHRRRIQQFERRISTLTLPAELRRAIAAGAHYLREPEPDPVRALRAVVTASRQTLGHRAGEAVTDAVRRAREPDFGTAGDPAIRRTVGNYEPAP